MPERMQRWILATVSSSTAARRARQPGARFPSTCGGACLRKSPDVSESLPGNSKSSKENDMAEFAINADVVTNTPTVEVTLSPAKPLPLGRHQFRLIVVDDSGNKSIGDVKEVLVADLDNPTAFLSAPTVVGFGRSFLLDGSKSFD